MSVYDQYETDAQVEVEGIWHQFEGFGLRLARAGGSNANYLAAIAKRAENLRGKSRADLAKSGIMQEVYADAVITEIEGTEFTTREGVIPEPGSDEVAQILKDLPELFQEIQGLATDRRFYKIVGDSTEKK